MAVEWKLTGHYLSTARTANICIGTSSSTVCAGGSWSTGDGITYDVNTTEKYNGSAWSNVSGATVSGPGEMGYAGIANDGIAFGGSSSNSLDFLRYTDKWNGVTWSRIGAQLSYGRSWLMGFGLSNSATAVGGYDYNKGADYRSLKYVEAFNGSSWSTRSQLPIGIFQGCGFGSAYDAVVCAGVSNFSSDTSTTDCYLFTGFSWAATGRLNVARMGPGGLGTGKASGVAFGGFRINGSGPDVNSSTEICINGYWGTLATTLWKPIGHMGSSGTTTNGIYCGGNDRISDWTTVQVLSEPTFFVSIPSLETTVGTPTTVNISGVYDTMTASSRDTSIVTVSVSGKNLTLTGMGGGVHTSRLHVY